ncbi:MAG: carboxypeptidase-like regulatory domain-containing protein [Ignavibacteriales bacterium]|nr:carboxypeptidase-like regulatory domain-containing protein [Ignavibacteriales bacterium]
MKLFLILFFTFTSFLFAQKTNLTGKIYNLQTRRPIPFVNVGIQGTYFGTSSNEYGNFKLVLSNGSYNLIVSCVGFESTIIKVSIPNENEISINLKPIPIELPEVVIDADENPAYTQ